MSDEFLGKIKDKSLAIAIVGLGYVGLPLAVAFAKKKFKVIGIDADSDRIEHLIKGESYIVDIDSAELKKVVPACLTPTTQFSYLKDADCIIICVPTPLKRKYHPDISFIKSAVREISKRIKKGALVILESTTFPGTTEEVILPMIEQNNLVHGKDFWLCFSPERIDPGNASFPLEKIAKVVGGVDECATEMAQKVYSLIIDKVVPVSSPRVA